MQKKSLADYNKFIPSQSFIQAKINVKALTEMIERASIIINYDDPKIPVVIKLKNSEVSVECISKYGNFCESIDVDKYGAVTSQLTFRIRKKT